MEKLEQLREKLTLQNRLAIYKDIELTEEEVQELIYQEKKKRAAKKAEEEYSKKLAKLAEPKIFTSIELRTFIEKKSEAIGCGKFIVDETNKEIIQELCYYFTGENSKYNPQKGIALFGNVGCGKTTLMRLFNENQISSFRVVSCRKIAAEFASGGDDGKGGHSAIEKYFKTLLYASRNMFGQEVRGICFDDLGTESEKKNFGNQLNVMAEVLLNCYDNPVFKGNVHLTTNLSADEIEQMYGTRVRSRMREMFNIIKFPETATDRRV